MFRSPISPATFCTSARSSSRNVTSSGDSGAAFEIFLPGILIPNHQSNAKNAVIATVMRSPAQRIFESLLWPRRSLPTRFPESRPTLCNFFPELQRAENEQQVGHQNENRKIRPVFEEICAA